MKCASSNNDLYGKQDEILIYHFLYQLIIIIKVHPLYDTLHARLYVPVR